MPAAVRTHTDRGGLDAYRVGVVTAQEVEELLKLGHETRPFEVKGPGSLNEKAYVARVARAAMALGNLQDGGLVCLGIEDKKMADLLPGLDAVQLGEWSDFDNVNDALARYADPPVQFELRPLALSSKAKVVVLEIAEFHDVPHICNREYEQTLRRGMTYCRPRGKPESVPIPSETEMRDLLDLATTKGVREFIRRAGAAGVPLNAPQTADDLTRAEFDREATLAWANPGPVVSQLLALGHTDVSIRPEPFDTGRISAPRLLPQLEAATVRLRGWPVPFIDLRQRPLRGAGWIGQDVGPGAVRHVEAWRLCTSGQFLHRRALVTDLEAGSVAQLRPDAADATGAVAVWDVLLYLVEVAEMAARFVTALDCPRVSVEASVRGIAGRQLISGQWSRDLFGPYITDENTLTASLSVDSTVLITDPTAVGIRLSRALLEQFGVELSDQLLRGWQAETFPNR